MEQDLETLLKDLPEEAQNDVRNFFRKEHLGKLVREALPHAFTASIMALTLFPDDKEKQRAFIQRAASRLAEDVQSSIPPQQLVEPKLPVQHPSLPPACENRLR